MTSAATAAAQAPAMLQLRRVNNIRMPNLTGKIPRRCDKIRKPKSAPATLASLLTQTPPALSLHYRPIPRHVAGNPGII
jgi:hypothetical protein